jgi:hypothetical protein
MKTTTKMTISIADAIKAQPKLEDEPGFRLWIENDDWDALDEALENWGFGKTNDDGEIEEEE